MRLSTLIIHPYVRKYNTFIPPIVNGATIFNNGYGTVKKRVKKNVINYGIHGNDVSKYLEKIMVTLEGCRYALLFNSGLQALSFIYFTLVGTGEGVAIPSNIYRPNRDILKVIAKNFKVCVVVYNPWWGYDKLREVLAKARVKVLVIETPGSITFEMVNLRRMVNVAKAIGIHSVVDGAYYGGLGDAHFDYGVDIVVQVITKYHSGGGDILMGVILTRSKGIYRVLTRMYDGMGVNVSSNDCANAIKSVSSLMVRVREQRRNAYILVRWLSKYRKVLKVCRILFPKIYSESLGLLEGKGDCKISGTFSVKFKSMVKKDVIYSFVNGLRLFKIGYSWGGAISLIMVYEDVYRDGIVIRFSIGLEDVNDLQKDLASSFVRFVLDK